MTTPPSARHEGVGRGSRRIEPEEDPRFLGAGWPFANREDEQNTVESLIAGSIDEACNKLGFRPAPKIEEPVPEPDFKSAGILFGPQFLFDALTRRNQMYDCLKVGARPIQKERTDLTEDQSVEQFSFRFLPARR